MRPSRIDNPSTVSMTDGELVRRAQQGERPAFDELIVRHQPIALSLATRIVGDREWGLELTQEAILQAYLSLESLRKPNSFRAWLCGIVVNLCKNDLRRPRVDTMPLELLSGGRSFDSLPFAASAPQPHAVAQAKETHRLILAAVAQLSPANREAILLYYFEQLSVREVASLLQISVPAVKGRLHKSRRQLRAELRSTFAELEPRPTVAHLVGAKGRQTASASTKQTRSKQMIPVTVLDIVIPDPESDHRILVLMDEGERRLLAIWIGPYEADNIALNLQGQNPGRPITYGLIANLLDKGGVQIESVVVSALENETFFATIHAQNGDGSFDVDARPSDAIALALYADSPIFVAAEVMDAVAEAVPDDMEIVARGQGLHDVLRASGPTQSQEEQEAWQRKSPQERREENRTKLLAYITEMGCLGQSEAPADE